MCRASIDRRASLVPAAAVIPAPKAYAYVVAVEKLVVGIKLFADRAPAERPRVANETKDGGAIGGRVPKGRVRASPKADGRRGSHLDGSCTSRVVRRLP